MGGLGGVGAVPLQELLGGAGDEQLRRGVEVLAGFGGGGADQQHEVFEGVHEVDAVFAEAVDFLAVGSGGVERVPAGGAGRDVDGDGFEGAHDGVVGVARVGNGDVGAEDVETGRRGWSVSNFAL